MPWTRLWALVAALFVLGPAACSADDAAEPSAGGIPSVDAGTAGVDASASGGNLPELRTSLREDFDNTNLIDATGGAIIDVNRGTASLPVIWRIIEPGVNANAPTEISDDVERNGLIEATEFTLKEGATFHAPDSVELRCAGTVRIAGNLTAGPGGITLVAKGDIEVSGRMQSTGPVVLALVGEESHIAITGHLETWPESSNDVPSISLVGRGAVAIAGTVATYAATGQRGGDITLEVYDRISIDARAGRVATSARPGGTPGSVRLTSDVEIELGPDTAMFDLRDLDPELTSEALPGGAIEMRAPKIVFGARAHLGPSVSAAQAGTRLRILASDFIGVGAEASIMGGASAGETGGDVHLEANRIVLEAGARIEAGAGSTFGGQLSGTAASALEIGEDALLQGGSAACGQGGEVRLVAETMAAGARAVVRGGNGNNDAQSNGCPAGSGSRGGDVTVSVEDATGIEDTLVSGDGEEPGHVVQLGAPTLPLSPPDLGTQTEGWIESRVFDRSASSVGLVPRLVDGRFDRPLGTAIEILLSGSPYADGPFDTWIDALSQSLDPTSDGRYFRYRIALRGRRFDAPVLDGFEIDLAPDE